MTVMDSPRRMPGSPANTGQSGDGGNRTRASVLPKNADRNIVLCPRTDWLTHTTDLPLVHLPHEWHTDELRALIEARITEKGYRKGHAPGNKGKVYDDFEIATDDEIRQLIAACNIKRLSGRRNAAHIAFLRGTGLRVQESCDFLPSDLSCRLDDEGREYWVVLVRHGKGDKRARCGITPWALEATLAWIEDRKAAGFTDDQPLFPVVEGRSRGGRMHTAYVRDYLSQLARRAKVDKRVNPHSFRHALALDMDRRGTQLTVISKQLRHSNVATTATYLKKLSDVEVYSTMRDMDWGQA